MEASTATETSPAHAFYTKADLATLLACSERHVDRLRDAGKIPSPVRIGGLVRWHRPAIEAWVAAGCPQVLREATTNA